MDCGLPCSSVLQISQAGILEWVAMPSSRGPSRPRKSLTSPALPVSLTCPALGSLPLAPLWEAQSFHQMF